MLETIQETGDPVDIVTEWHASSASRPSHCGLRDREDGMAEPTLYERLGGIFAIAAVVDHFSDQLLKTRRWSRQTPS